MTTPQIEYDELHLWCASMRDFDADIPLLRSALSSAEKLRAGKFRFLRDENNYIIRHGILRMLLANYLGQSTSDLSFTTTVHGKPELRRGFFTRKIHFNVSHSGNVTLFGITGACPIGVDVERVRVMPHCGRIASEYFPAVEIEGLMTIPEESRLERFFEMWTRTEALLKATGEGLGSRGTGRKSLPAENVSTLVPTQVLRPSSRWHVLSFSPLPGYVAAVAFSRPGVKLICKRIPGFSSKD